MTPDAELSPDAPCGVCVCVRVREGEEVSGMVSVKDAVDERDVP